MRRLASLRLPILLVLVTAVMVLACGGDGPEKPPPPPSPVPLPGTVEAPTGPGQAEIWVYGGEDSVLVRSDGTFTLPAAPADTSLVMAVMNGDDTRPLMSLSGPGATSTSLTMKSTAIALMLLSPELATDDDQQRARIAEDAAALPEVDAFASALGDAYQGAGDPLDDPGVLATWTEAIDAVLVREGSRARTMSDPVTDGRVRSFSAGGR
jgi:hypothetical protein